MHRQFQQAEALQGGARPALRPLHFIGSWWHISGRRHIGGRWRGLLGGSRALPRQLLLVLVAVLLDAAQNLQDQPPSTSEPQSAPCPQHPETENTAMARACTRSTLQSPASRCFTSRVKPGERARRVRAGQVRQRRAAPCRAPPRPPPSCQSRWPARHTCTALASARHRPCLCASSGSARQGRAARAGPHALLGLQLVQHLLQLLDGELEQPARALCLSAGPECLAACCQFCQSRHTC